jgi:hypothetical protein
LALLGVGSILKDGCLRSWGLSKQGIELANHEQLFVKEDEQEG